jgi:sialic acid synthase SpsE
MGTFRQAFGWPVGYSDHTEGTAACLAAVALGASVLEKHFTLDRSLPGPDHAGSSDPTEFEALVRTVRQVEAALGSPIKRPTEAENRNAKGMRRSIVAYRDIAQGSILREADLAFKRPGDGIAPALAAHISGRRARIDIAADKQITWTDLE